jgi:hypothetical protein
MKQSKNRFAREVFKAFAANADPSRRLLLIRSAQAAAAATVDGFAGYTIYDLLTRPAGLPVEESKASPETGGKGGGVAVEGKMPYDMRLRVTDNPAIRAAVAAALGANETDITPQAAVGSQKDKAGTFSWFSASHAVRLQVSFGERYFESSKGRLDRMPPTPKEATAIEIPGADRAFFVGPQGHLEVAGEPADNYTLGVSLSFRDPALPLEQGGFTGPHPNAQQVTANVASLIVSEYFAG